MFSDLLRTEYSDSLGIYTEIVFGFGRLLHPEFLMCVMFVPPQTHMTARGKVPGFIGTSVHTTYCFGFKSIRIRSLYLFFRIRNLRIPDQTVYFLSGFILLCVNGQTNPVSKRFGFATTRRGNFCFSVNGVYKCTTT